jgi:hypothetical protein
VASAVKWLQRWYQQRSAAPKPRGGGRDFGSDRPAAGPDLGRNGCRTAQATDQNQPQFALAVFSTDTTSLAPRSQVVSAHDNLTSLRQRIRSLRYFPGQDGDPRVPVLINRFGVDDAIFLTRVPVRPLGAHAPAGGSVTGGGTASMLFFRRLKRRCAGGVTLY